MPNPYAARRRRTSARTGTFPAGRLRQAGATDAELDYWRAVLAELGPEDRADQLAEWAAMDTVELGQAVKLSMTGVPDGAGEELVGRLGYTLDAVPDGNVDAVVGWVRAGDSDYDRALRAEAALEVEAQRDRPRTGLTDPLERLAGA